MAISSILSQIHQQVWRWSLETNIIHTKLKNQFLLRENPWKTWQKMCFNKMLQLIQIIMVLFMIHRNIWALRDHRELIKERHLIMGHSATCCKIMAHKEICIEEIKKIHQVFIKVIQANLQRSLKVCPILLIA